MYVMECPAPTETHLNFATWSTILRAAAATGLGQEHAPLRNLGRVWHEPALPRTRTPWAPTVAMMPADRRPARRLGTGDTSISTVCSMLRFPGDGSAARCSGLGAAVASTILAQIIIWAAHMLTIL